MTRNFILLLFTIAALNSCKKSNKIKPIAPSKAYKVLILGNSTAYSPPNADVSWYGNWGMAATAPEKDFVHILTSRFKKANESTTVAVYNIGEFEFFFDTFDIEAHLKTFRDANPDLLIIKIGESVNRNSEAELFEKRYVELLNYFKAHNPKIKILSAGSIYLKSDMSDRVMRTYSKFVSLRHFYVDRENFAYYASNTALQVHPSDTGMQVIADAIWSALTEMIY